MKVKEVYDFINGIAPFASQAGWDNSGLLVGGPGSEFSKALLCLDLTNAAARFAAENGCGLIVSHHPVIFRALKSVNECSVLNTLIQNGAAVIGAHTNLDIAPGGVNDTLCEALGMEYEKCGPAVCEGFLNVGTFGGPVAPEALARKLANRLRSQVRFISGGAPVERAAVCAGAGGEFAAQAKALGCNALITGEADHHDMLDAAAIGVSLFAAGHFETEILIVPKLHRLLCAAFPQAQFLVYPEKAPFRTAFPAEE